MTDPSITVDEATGRPYDPDAPRGQDGVSEAFGKPPEGYEPSRDSDAARGVQPEDKLPGNPPVVAQET